LRHAIVIAHTATLPFLFEAILTITDPPVFAYRNLPTE
jgi:hypothetical protein